MVRWSVAAVILAAVVAVAILTAWQWGVALVLVVVVGVALWYVRGTGQDAGERWSRSLYGSDPDDEHHWTKRP